MIAEVATLATSISLAEAGREHFARTGYGGYPVVRDGRVVGLLCLRDLLRHPLDERETTSVQAGMTPLGEEVTIAPDQPPRASLRKMSETGSTRLLVMEEGRLAGYLTLGTLMRHRRVRERLSS
jgi:CBS domain-containing protein